MPPNFIVIVTDDQGYGDLSCMGCEDFRTPNIDRLAGSGARLTDWYANGAVCSPTRASLLTGRYPINAGVRTIVRGHRTSTGLLPHVPTIPKALQNRKYRTFMSGKWHLGLADECRPHSHGFDHWFGFLAGCIDYYSHVFYYGMNRPGMNPIHDLWNDNKEVWANGQYMTEMITDKAIGYIREAADAEQPFFLYVTYNAPHYPMHAPQRYLDRFRHLPADRRIMAAMLAAVDDGVGQILDELTRQGLREDTCIFFTSDNGPSRESRNWFDGTLDFYYGGTAGKLKGHKGSLFDGGIRVPGLVSWPARVPAGQVLDAPCATMDLFPTILAAAGAAPDGYELDGTNLLSYLCDGTPLAQRDIYWERDKQTAVRRGRWKLVLNGQLVENGDVTDEVWLSDLSTDMGECVNVKDVEPSITAELKAAAESWRERGEARWRSEFSAADQGSVAFRGV